MCQQIQTLWSPTFEFISGLISRVQSTQDNLLFLPNCSSLYAKNIYQKLKFKDSTHTWEFCAVRPFVALEHSLLFLRYGDSWRVEYERVFKQNSLWWLSRDQGILRGICVWLAVSWLFCGPGDRRHTFWSTCKGTVLHLTHTVSCGGRRVSGLMEITCGKECK